MSSPFSSLLGTNYCPEDDEVGEIKALLVEPSQRLKRLDDVIAGLQNALDQLMEERARLSAHVDAHKALRSPVRRLPLDIIQEIFVACIPTHRNCAMSALEAPVLLGRICRSWRDISLSTPRLWSKIHIVEPTCPYNSVIAIFEEKLALRLETTKTWLGRSGQCPLSISLQSTFDRTGFTLETQQLLIDALLPFAARWEHITLTTLFSVLATASHLTPADVPMLKSVSISEIHEPTQDTVRWHSLTFLRGPEIYSFHIMGSSFGPMELPLGWERLTDLSIAERWMAGGPSLTSDMSFQVFSRCPKLRTCRLLVHDGLDLGYRAGEQDVLDLPALNSLDLQCVGTLSSTVHRLFGRLSFPHLRHCKLRGNSNRDDNISFAPFLAATPRLETLDINIELFTKPSLDSFLHGLASTIREIQINEFPICWREVGSDIFDDDILASLTTSTDLALPCCPALQALEINYCGSFFDQALFDQALLRFIQSRALKRVVVHFARDMELDICPKLDELVQGGLHMELTYPPPAVLQFSPWLGLPDAPHFTDP
ncbi:hypothetical protein B0H15DRAFT_948602 [Mycena belliarum]|uniref:F-box domain-containing protein n=1 Tax=Mycena belliarum TaxID=1033014 RepID=A0AAD6U7H4_9AGAR|nr:hypothetical protein B0H15DRAFT_948602 [Mycena belliae]